MRELDVDVIGTDELLQLARRHLHAWTVDALALVPEDDARVDAHCHIGVDSDGSRMDEQRLLDQLDEAGMHFALVTALHQPDGYVAENERIRDVAAASGGRLLALHRCDPRAGDPARDAQAGLASGAVGLKWHPRAERFAMDDDVAWQTAAVANEAAAPILIHAGRGMDRLGEGVVELAREFPDATFLLAHAAISDIAWIVDATREVPNVAFDTSWWRPTDLATLLSSCDPARVLHGSDPPYGSARLGLQMSVRLARACGWDDAATRGLLGGNARRLFGIGAGQDTSTIDPPRPAFDAHMPIEDPAMRRASELLAAGLHVAFGDGDAEEVFDLAIAALDVLDTHDHARTARALQSAMQVGVALLQRDDFGAHVPVATSFMSMPESRRVGVHLLICTLAHLATPALPVRAVDRVSWGNPAPFV